MDNYEILGIKKDSNLIEINKKYRELIEIYKATKYEETTKFLENEKKIREINIAYINILKMQDENKKNQQKESNKTISSSENYSDDKSYINTQNILILTIILISFLLVIFINFWNTEGIEIKNNSLAIKREELQLEKESIFKLEEKYKKTRKLWDIFKE